MAPVPLATLTRWVLHGGTTAELARTADHVTVALLRCDGGEQVEVVEVGTTAWDGWSSREQH